ncbi:serine hydrolase [Robiginitalea sp. SC105]|uniref:serine hydrolase domain-containing protein n=1 Tax=Robiginitalea sp. SC105 TaxID=2762332 RepID=UPI00163A770D|nr:serine hydrolase domain-containing protein [Robiginitalea sp. SC105]MBC2838341.1 serine hydrolase [Robiginitalea sp. SC105]
MRDLLLYILIGILFCEQIHGQSGASDPERQALVSVTPATKAPATRAPARDLPVGSLEEFGVDSVALYQQVDSLMELGIRSEAFPGGQLHVAYRGKQVFHKTYGFHTYDSLYPTRATDLYDLASVTKIAAALPALMRLTGEGKLDLDAPFSDYWHPWRRRRDKRDLTLREILAHQAGLEPYIVFLSDVRSRKGLKRRFVREHPSPRFGREAYAGRYVKDRFIRKMYRKINRSEVSKEKTYRYSGLTFLLFPEVVRELTGKPFDTYLRENIYDPLGLDHLAFLPARRLPGMEAVPTELDTLFRNDLTRGWVHDENAALMGGISGNAGLFGTAQDLAVLMQCYANYGTYQGVRVLDSATVREFARVQYPENDNRRGLGFDKPLPDNPDLSLEEAYPAPQASERSFGHSGFTGTFIWADPEYQLVFIFLSNRVYPSRDHRQLYELGLRTRLQQAFYSALISAH